MDLTGYGYRRSVLRQEIPEVTTSAVQKSEALSAELSGEALRLLIKVNTKVALQELSVRFPSVLNRIADVWRNPAQAERCFDELLLKRVTSRSIRNTGEGRGVLDPGQPDGTLVCAALSPVRYRR